MTIKGLSPGEGIELEWEAPSDPSLNPPKIFIEVLAKVKARPGSWARIRTAQSSTAYTSRQRLEQTAGRSDERWEFVNKKLENGSGAYGVFARYRTPEQMEAAQRKKR